MTIRDRIATFRAVAGGTHFAVRGRALLAIAAIAFGVALGFAVDLINRAAVDELASGLAQLSGRADLDVRGPRAGFDEAIYPLLARDEAVAAASPIVEVAAKLRDRDAPLAIVGVDVFRAAEINPALVAIGADRLDTLRGDALFPSAAAMRWLGARVGDEVVVQAGLHDLPLRVAGSTGVAGGSRYAVMDIAAVQDRFDRVGRLTRIDLRLRPGVDRAAAQRRLQAQLPAGVHVAPPAAATAATARFSRAYRINLNVLALVALFTGAMLVFATQTLAIARRRTPFALLRTLGLSRGRLVRTVIAEAALEGAVGAAIGLAAGYVIAWAALREFGADLGAGFFRGQALAPALAPLSLLIFAALGIAAAVLGSALPAREAARAEPAAALKAADADAVVPARTATAALALIVAGIVAAGLPAVADLPLFGYLAIALILIGGIFAISPLAQAALRRAPMPQALPAALALAHLRATPGRMAATLSAMIASVALMVAMAIMVASFRQSLDDWLGAVLPADLYLRMGSDSAFFAPEDQRAIVAARGVARVEFTRTGTVDLDPSRPQVALVARDIDPENAAARLALVAGPVDVPGGAAPPAWISEAVADAEGLAPGRTFALPVGGRAVAFTVAGVFRDYARQQGSVVIERSRYRALTGDDTVNEAALWLEPGASAATTIESIDAYAGRSGRFRAATASELRRLSLATFDRTFAVTYALEAAAVVIGLIGLSAALAAQTLARSREFGVLQHIGMTRRQIGAMLGVEGATLGVIGVASGLVIGFAISLILVHVVDRQSFHWGMDLHVPWRLLAGLAATLLALVTLTARSSARAATRVDAVRAVREDW